MNVGIRNEFRWVKIAPWCNVWDAGVKRYTKLVNEVKSNMESETKSEISERTLNERGEQEMTIYIRMCQQRVDGLLVTRYVRRDGMDGI